MNYKPTQHDLAESGRRRAARKAHAVNWMMHQDNRPTAEELKRLREKNPTVWDSFPDSAVR